MALTERQKYLTWKTFDARRWGYLRQSRRIFKNAITSQVQPIIKQLEDKGIDYVKRNIYLDTRPLELAYRRTYNMVSIPFAQQSFNSLRGKSEKAEGDWERVIQEWIGLSVSDRLEAVTLTSKDKILRIINSGIETGMSIQDMAARIASDVGGVQRATRIARTEVISASNLGSLQGAKATELPLNKSWLATRDARTRETHSEVDGQTVTLEEQFTVGGFDMDFPGDWTYGADVSEIVNCRCTQVYEVRR
jgi:hypothetical protein